MVIVAVHTGAVSEPSAFAAGLAAVSKERRERVLSLAKAEDQRRSVCAGLALNACLRAVGLPTDAVIARDRRGKPFLSAYPHRHFSLSHSGSYAVCAMADAPIGIDIQEQRPVAVLPLAERFFAPSEVALLRSLPEVERERAFYRLWTAKESILKADGVGLAGGLSRVTVTYGERLSSPSRQLKEYALPGYALTVCGNGEFPEDITIIFSCDTALLR